jgi:uncharacterized membrane protein YdjX (TVP38/TMEM64 family)
MARWQKAGALVMAALVIGGHVALWQSDRVPDAEKLRLTLVNAGIWAVVLLPALGVAMWARQHRGRGPDRD